TSPVRIARATPSRATSIRPCASPPPAKSPCGCRASGSARAAACCPPSAPSPATPTSCRVAATRYSSLPTRKCSRSRSVRPRELAARLPLRVLPGLRELVAEAEEDLQVLDRAGEVVVGAQRVLDLVITLGREHVAHLVRISRRLADVFDAAAHVVERRAPHAQDGDVLRAAEGVDAVDVDLARRALQRIERILHVIARAEEAALLARRADEEDRAAGWQGKRTVRAREREEGGDARSVVDGAVIDLP